MRRWLLLAGATFVSAAIALSYSTSTQAATFGYTFDITTFYQSGSPAGGTLNNVTGAPDTGFVTIANDGTTIFTGSLGTVANASSGVNYSFTSSSLTLSPGQSVTLGIGIGGVADSSNVGGFNGPSGIAQPGVEVFLNGLINGSEAVNLSVNDSNIHSGVPRTNPLGVTLDNYVLQGGDPLGRDTGDAYEETQAPGHFEFLEASPRATTPLPAALPLFATGLGLIAVAGYRRKRKAQAVA